MRKFLSLALLLLCAEAQAGTLPLLNAGSSAAPAPSGTALIPNIAVWSGTDCSIGVTPTCAPPAVDTTTQGQQNITGAASHGGLIQLTVTSTTKMASDDMFVVAGVVGTTEANNKWLITVIDGTHVDLKGSTFTNAYVSGGTIGFNETAIAAFDEYPYAVVETAGAEIITVGGAIANRGWIDHVTFYLGGNTLNVSSQTKNANTGDFGWAATVQSAPTQNGDITLYADVYPVNGKVKRISLPLWLNSAVAGTGYVNRLDSSHLRYVNYSTGNDSWNGTSATFTSGTTGPWKTLGKATSSAPSGGVVSVAPGTYVEDANPSAQNNARMIDLRALTGGVTVTRTTRTTSPNAIWATRGNRITYDGITAGGITIDMSKIVQVKGGNAGCILIFKHIAFTDPNGTTGPQPYGYSSLTPSDFLQSPFLGDAGGASITSVLGIAESTMSTYTISNPRFMRNVTVSYSADTVAMTNNIANSNTSWWGVTASKTGDFKPRASDTNTVTVGSTSGTGPTTISLSGTPTIISSNPQYVTFLSGALNGQTFLVSSINAGARTITTALNTSTAGVGSTMYFYTLVHADAFQLIGNLTQIALPPDNVYFQRYKNTRSSTDFLLQPLLGQAGAFAGTGTVTTTGTSFQFSSSVTVNPNEFISLAGGSQKFQYQRIMSVTAQPCTANVACGTLEAPFTVNQSGTAWAQSKTASNVAIIDAIFDGPGAPPSSLEHFQPQNGHAHWVMAQVTLSGIGGIAGSDFDWRTNGTLGTSAVPLGGFGISSFGIFDNLWNGGTANTSGPSMTADAIAGFPTYGFAIDNNQFAYTPLRGTNGASGFVTLDSNFTPTSGLSLTMRGVQKGTVADGTPFVPWDIYGTAISSGALVGAVAQ